MNNAGDYIYAETPNVEIYFRMTDQEKDIELQKSIMRMHSLIFAKDAIALPKNRSMHQICRFHCIGLTQ